MKLETALEHLDAIAPLALSASWDNTGLLLEGDRDISRVLITIDLTPSVCEEAVEHDVDLVVAYHPPIFGGLKHITKRSARGRTLLTLARRGVHVYSPHTALDSVPTGINDWLLEPFGPVHDVLPIEPALDRPEAGVGRTARLANPRTLGALVPVLKAFLGLPAVRVSGPLDQRIERVAVCPGAGGSVFERVRGVDLLLTGEMRHHDVLGFASRGVSAILTDHTNTERGFLPIYGRRITERLDVEVHIAQTDADPLVVR